MVPVLFTVYIQNVVKLKKNNSGAKRLKCIFAFIDQAIRGVAREPWKSITYLKLRTPPKLVTILHSLKLMIERFTVSFAAAFNK